MLHVTTSTSSSMSWKTACAVASKKSWKGTRPACAAGEFGKTSSTRIPWFSAGSTTSYRTVAPSKPLPAHSLGVTVTSRVLWARVLNTVSLAGQFLDSWIFSAKMDWQLGSNLVPLTSTMKSKNTSKPVSAAGLPGWTLKTLTPPISVEAPPPIACLPPANERPLCKGTQKSGFCLAAPCTPYQKLEPNISSACATPSRTRPPWTSSAVPRA
mmetsp:Transcript_138320/g.442032  ORF Transcript_138320/g.442032 Transcript_138320/m.442032 type:complete len:212 (-) Transcript_138320:249-884(-)